MYDGAPAHRSISTIDFLSKKKKDILNWPARSPDLNIMETIWGVLFNKIYENVQYRRLDDLWQAIESVSIGKNAKIWHKQDKELNLQCARK